MTGPIGDRWRCMAACLPWVWWVPAHIDELDQETIAIDWLYNLIADCR